MLPPFTRKNKNDISHTAKSIINTITVVSPILVGSYNFRSRTIWGDLDCLEYIISDRPGREGIEEIARGIQRIVMRVYENPNYVFSDFKAGLDNRAIDNLESLLTEEEMNLFVQLDKKDKEEFIKKFHVLRWSPLEIIRGYKTLRGNKIMKLEEAITYPSTIKIDVFVMYFNRYIEASNFIVIGQQKARTNKLKIYNAIPDLYNLVKRDIKIYKEEGQYFKALKRKFVLLRLEYDNETDPKKKKLIEEQGAKILLYVNGSIGLIGFIKSYCDDLLVMIEKIDKFNRNKAPYFIKNLCLSIDSLKDNASNSLIERKSLNRIQKLIDELYEICRRNDFDLLLKNKNIIENIKKELD